PDSRLRGDRDRRHRLDTRRVHRRIDHRACRHARPLVCRRHHAAVHGALACPHGWAGDRLDADLSLDGARVGLPSRRVVPGQGPLTMADIAAPLRPAAARPGRLAGNVLPLVLFAAFAVVPVFAALTTEAYVLGLVTRVMIFAIAALALDLLVGYGAL